MNDNSLSVVAYSSLLNRLQCWNLKKDFFFSADSNLNISQVKNFGS